MKERAGQGAKELTEKELLDKQAMAASLIASHWKRKMVQRKFQRMRNEEFAFLGMVAPERNSQTLDHIKIEEEVSIFASTSRRSRLRLLF